MGTEHTGIADSDAPIPELRIPEPVILAFELVGYEAANLDDRIRAALQKEDVRREMEKGLNELAEHVVRKSLWSPPDTMTEKEKQEILNKFMAAATDPIKQDVWTQIQHSSRVRALEMSVKKLARDIDAKAGGIFTDKGWVYLVGSVLVLGGGAVAMWQCRTGDSVTDPLMSLGVGKMIPSVDLGKIEIGGELIKFQPKQHLVEAKLVATAKWERIQAKINVVGKWADDRSVKLTSTGQVLVPLGRGTTLTAAGRLGTDPKDAGFALGLGVKRGQVDLSVWATYGDPFPGSPAPYRGAASGGGGVGVLTTVSLHF